MNPKITERFISVGCLLKVMSVTPDTTVDWATKTLAEVYVLFDLLYLAVGSSSRPLLHHSHMGPTCPYWTHLSETPLTMAELFQTDVAVFILIRNWLPCQPAHMELTCPYGIHLLILNLCRSHQVFMGILAEYVAHLQERLLSYKQLTAFPFLST